MEGDGAGGGIRDGDRQTRTSALPHVAPRRRLARRVGYQLPLFVAAGGRCAGERERPRPKSVRRVPDGPPPFPLLPMDDTFIYCLT